MHSVTVHIVHTHDRHLAAEIQLYHSMLCSAVVMFKMVTLQGYQLELLGKIGYWLLILKQTVDISFFFKPLQNSLSCPNKFPSNHRRSISVSWLCTFSRNTRLLVL